MFTKDRLWSIARPCVTFLNQLVFTVRSC